MSQSKKSASKASGPAKSGRAGSTSGARPGTTRGGSRPGATRTSTDGRPPAKSSGLGRPRIRASHSEGAATEGKLPAKEIERRRARAKASVRSLGEGPAPKRQLPPPPSKRDPSVAKRKSGAPAQAASTAAQELALAIAAAGLDKKAVGVEVIDVSGRVDYADYLVIMTGTSDRHVHAIAMGIEEALKRKRVAPLSVEGLGTATWVLMDFSDVVVHVFQEDSRRVYDIEGLWMDAGRLNVPAETAAKGRPGDGPSAGS